MLGLAIKIAVNAHEGQTDKGGNPYILHPLRVMMSVESESEKIVAILHDVVEDSEFEVGSDRIRQPNASQKAYLNFISI